jgi:peptidoglycan lytic transglycosylase
VVEEWRRHSLVVVAFTLGAATIAGCTRAVVTPEPGKPQTGIASWYGPGFHGRPASNGETYDQNALTAAHPTLPFGTRALVTNLSNGRSVEVRITDRGPFKKDRVIDLSRKAAQTLGMIGPGTAPVRINVVARPPGGYSQVLHCVQVGAFHHRDRARALRDQLAVRYGDVYISTVTTRSDKVYRVRVGPFFERRYAIARATDLANFGYPAIVTEEPRP